MNKSIGLIIFLLSVKSVVASSEVKLCEVTADNFSSQALQLHEVGGEAALMQALIKIEKDAVDQALNPENEEKTALEVAYLLNDDGSQEARDKSLKLCGFFLRHGANPYGQTSKASTIWERVQSDSEYLGLMIRSLKIRKVEQFVIQALNSSNEEEFNAAVAMLRDLGKTNVPVEDEKQALPENGRVMNGVTPSSDDENTTDDRKTEEKTDELVEQSAEDQIDTLSLDDKVEALESLKNENIDAAQNISRMQDRLDNTDRGDVLRPGHSNAVLGAVALGSIGITVVVTWLFAKSVFSNGDAN